jgi:hypothetical protein
MRPWLPRIVAGFVFLGIALLTMQIAVAVRDPGAVGDGYVVIFGLSIAGALATARHHGISLLVGK